MKTIKLFLVLIGILTITFYACNDDNKPPKKDDPIDNANYWNEGLSEGVNYGIAANYVNDKGLANNQHVVAFENFETGTVTLPTEEDRYKTYVQVVNFGAL